MLFYDLHNFTELCLASLVIPLIIVACMLYAYIVNALRPADDPEKKEYELGAVLIAPFTFPIFASLGILVFVARAILFAVYLVVLTIGMVAFRKPFILAWLHKFSLKIGDPLLKINTQLFRLAWGQWNDGAT